MDNGSFDLRAAAEGWLKEAGFETNFSPDARRQADEAGLSNGSTKLPEGVEDLRELLWSSVDNVESRDLDQIEVAEKLSDGDIVVRVAIADVDARVPQGSALDARAAANATTVYGGVQSWPMLPEALSCGLTSLLEGQDRLSIVTELRVNPDGTLESTRIFRALVKNKAKLDYESVGVWLDGGAPPTAITNDPALAAQLKLQDEGADRFAALRKALGALDFETLEANPVMQDGKVVALTLTTKSQSRALIENFMIAVNGANVAWLREKGFPTIQRVVRTPRRWDKIVAVAKENGAELPPTPNSKALSDFLSARKAADPAGFPQLSLTIVKLLGPGEYVRVAANSPDEIHFGLAVQGYTHSTAPNRRYPDIVIQRLIKAALRGEKPPYSDEQLDAIAARCNLMGDAANKVERRIRKSAAALLLDGHEGESFDGVVTGASDKGVYIRLSHPPLEGRIVRGYDRLDVGDRVRVRLLSSDPRRGFIDFAKI